MGMRKRCSTSEFQGGARWSKNAVRSLLHHPSFPLRGRGWSSAAWHVEEKRWSKVEQSGRNGHARAPARPRPTDTIKFSADRLLPVAAAESETGATLQNAVLST